jgi:hypothetical protein
MISNLIRKALGPTLDNRFSGESIRLNTILNEMETALEDIKAIRASDIADNISTYDIACDLSLDAYEIARNIEIDPDDIDIDYSALGRHIVGNIDIDASDIDIDYSTLARDIADNIDLNEVNARINNVHTNLETVERKMDLILKHLGITPENA